MKAALKKIYKSLPFKQPAFNLLKKVWLPPKNITQHLYFDGFFDVEMEGGDSFKFLAHCTQIDNEIFWYGLYGGWEKSSQKLWVDLCRDAKTIIDIGANDGLYSLAARAVNKEARIVCAEPLGFVLERLKANFKQNGFDDIELAEIAFSDYDGDAEMFVPVDADYIRSATVNTNLLDRKLNAIRLENILVERFDSYFVEHELEGLDLVKMDVESHEPEVLQGFGDLLKEYKPTILAEVSYERVPSMLNEILAPHGYLYFNIDENKGLRVQDELTLSDSDNFLICQPEVAAKYDFIPWNG
ncbi:MAG: FkbM family methyltransferase [Pyrinomonadaceae bacterium]